jgi:hypothetical protein
MMLWRGLANTPLEPLWKARRLSGKPLASPMSEKSDAL